VFSCFRRGQRLKVHHVKELLSVAEDETRQPTPTIGSQSNKPTLAEEQVAAVSPMTDRQRTVDLIDPSVTSNTVSGHQPADRQHETVSPVEETRYGYLIEIIEILGTQVTAKNLLIELLEKAGYSDLAHGLQTFQNERVRAAA
jgi:hypothetical protein